MWHTKHSLQDRSVNHVRPTSDGGLLECRYVQRTADYFIIYVSSHSGCNLSCRFCHLTATKQVMMQPASMQDYLDQVQQVLSTYSDKRQNGMPKVQKVHVNFMSRGEPLKNPVVLQQSQELFQRMEALILAVEPGVEVHFLLSSIVPEGFDQPFESVLQHPKAYLYYSLYSLDPLFRKKWLPKAKNPLLVLDALSQYQRQTSQRVALHWAIIKDGNDTMEQVKDIAQAVESRQLKAKFNLVRYNPHDERHGEEAEEATLHELFEYLQTSFADPDSRMVPRVGYDVKASCGMFVTGTE